MGDSDKTRLAAAVVDLHRDFEEALGESRRKYLVREFQLFAQAVRNYVADAGLDALIHRNVVKIVHGLGAYLRAERKTVPNEILFEAERLECLLFMGYDPYFEGDEPQDFSESIHSLVSDDPTKSNFQIADHTSAIFSMGRQAAIKQPQSGVRITHAGAGLNA